MNPYQPHLQPPYPGAYISAPPMGQPMMPGYPQFLPPPPPQGVPVARYAASFVPVMPQMMPTPMPIPGQPLLPLPPQAPNNSNAPSTPLSAPAPAPTTPRKAEETTITVYVGKIPTTVEDDFMRKILESCGEVGLWRRVTDPSSGRPKTFAFCDFKNPEGVLRATRLLHDLALGGNNLLLKVDEKNQKLLDAYTAKRNAEQHGATLRPGQAIAQTPAALAKEKEEDDAVRNKIKELVEKQEALISDRKSGKDHRDDDHVNGDDKSRLVSREIKNFRERQAQKDADKKDNRRDDDDDKKERDLRDRETDRQKEKDRLRLLRDRERERDARRKQREEKEFRDKEREWENRERKKEQEREDDKKKERREKEQRAQEIIDQENDDDEYMKKRIRSRDARKRRQREREDDDVDRVREKEELESRRREEEERKRVEDVKAQEAARIAAEEVKAQNEKRRMDELQQQRARMQQQKRGVSDGYDASSSSPPTDDNAVRLGFAKRAKLAPVAGFAPDAEDDGVVVKKKRAFVPLAYPEDGRSRKEDAQSVIDRIPTGKEELFAVEIDWALIDKNKIVEKKMKPWVTKKIVEFLGEEEKTLIDFIMNKIVGHIAPADLLPQLVPILDEEADIFVVKLWRMLVYEMFTAAKAS